MRKEAASEDQKGLESMKRPKPRIKRPNQIQELLIKTNEIVSEVLQRVNEIIGVVLVGGLSRGYGDELSEIDLRFFLHKQDFEKWMSRGAAFPSGDSLFKGQYVDFDFVCFEDEMDEEWSDYKVWDASTAKILYDPKGLIRDLFRLKIVFPTKKKEALLMKYVLTYGIYFYDLVVQQWQHRGDLLAAHHCLNRVLDSLIKTVFLVNDEFIPFEKWALNLSYSLPWLPKDWEKRITEAMLVQEISVVDIERRRSIIAALFTDVYCKLVGKERCDLDWIELIKYEALMTLHQTKRMKFEEFQTRYGASLGTSMLVMEPLYSLLNVKEKEGVKYVCFDEEKLKNLNWDAFLDWDQRLLRKLLT